MEARTLLAVTKCKVLLINLGSCSGKNSIADYLITKHNFTLIRLTERPLLAAQADSDAPSHVLLRPNGQARPQIGFYSFEDLIDYVTKRWREHFVVTDIRDEASLELLLRRPFALFVSVDAPLLVRWKRFSNRYV